MSLVAPIRHVTDTYMFIVNKTNFVYLYNRIFNRHELICKVQGDDKWVPILDSDDISHSDRTMYDYVNYVPYMGHRITVNRLKCKVCDAQCPIVMLNRNLVKGECPSCVERGKKYVQKEVKACSTNLLSSLPTEILGLVHSFVGINNTYSKEPLPRRIIRHNNLLNIRRILKYKFIRHEIPARDIPEFPYTDVREYETRSGISLCVRTLYDNRIFLILLHKFIKGYRIQMVS